MPFQSRLLTSISKAGNVRVSGVILGDCEEEPIRFDCYVQGLCAELHKDGFKRGVGP